MVLAVAGDRRDPQGDNRATVRRESDRASHFRWLGV